jgi:hypothetical protein
MCLNHKIKRLLTTCVLNLPKRLVAFNLIINARKEIKQVFKNSDIPKLKPHEIKKAKAFFKSQGYQLKNTSWHRYYKAMSGHFYKDYIPLDIFKSKIYPRLNQKTQRPALLDKNLSYNLFKDFDQP